jgi:hypothetical protein
MVVAPCMNLQRSIASLARRSRRRFALSLRPSPPGYCPRPNSVTSSPEDSGRSRGSLAPASGPPSRWVKPVPAFVAAFVPGTTRGHADEPATALQHARPTRVGSYSRDTPGRAAFEARGRPGPRTGHHTGRRRPSQISDGRPPIGPVASGRYPAGPTPYVPGSRPGIVSTRG